MYQYNQYQQQQGQFQYPQQNYYQGQQNPQYYQQQGGYQQQQSLEQYQIKVIPLDSYKQFTGDLSLQSLRLELPNVTVASLNEKDHYQNNFLLIYQSFNECFPNYKYYKRVGRMNIGSQQIVAEFQLIINTKKDIDQRLKEFVDKGVNLQMIRDQIRQNQQANKQQFTFNYQNNRFFEGFVKYINEQAK